MDKPTYIMMIFAFVLRLLKLVNDGATLTVKAPGIEVSAAGVVAIGAAIAILALVLT